jgi:Rrf2 family protein
MKFSTRTLYGLRAILVLAAREGAGLLSVSAIAKKENLSVHYLEQILNALKKKGLVKSVRGPQGGYTLSEKPASITLEKLFYALESKNGSSKIAASEGDETSLADTLFWNKFSASIEKGLSETTLKELLDEARRLKKGKSKAPAPTFHI